MRQGAITVGTEGKSCCFATKATGERALLWELGESVYPFVEIGGSASQLVAAQ
jgi:hypothetical protein